MVVDDVIDLAGQAELGDQGRAAARRAVAGDRLALFFPFCRQASGPLAQLLNFGVKVAQSLNVGQMAFGFKRE